MSYYDPPDPGDWDEEEEDDYYDEPEENEITVISEAEMLEALAEDAGDRAYDDQEALATIGPFPTPAPARIAPVTEGPQQGDLFQEVA